MGFNFRGIATSIKTENISDLTNLLGLETPTLIDKTYFEDAISSGIEANEIFLTVTSNGTILTVGEDIEIESMPVDKLSKNGKSLTFLVGETAMVFGFWFYENGKLLRNVINVEFENVEEEGEPLEIEHTEDDFTEVIFDIMETVCGDSFHTLEPDVYSVRYKLTFDNNNSTTQIEPTINDGLSHRKETKPWWKFW